MRLLLLLLIPVVLFAQEPSVDKMIGLIDSLVVARHVYIQERAGTSNGRIVIFAESKDKVVLLKAAYLPFATWLSFDSEKQVAKKPSVDTSLRYLDQFIVIRQSNDECLIEWRRNSLNNNSLSSREVLMKKHAGRWVVVSVRLMFVED